MSDETEMSPELNEFAKQLSQSKLPDAQINRDQLMYDAGWAAAKASTNATHVSTKPNGKNGVWTSIAVSFCSGVAAAALLMTVIPIVRPSDQQVAQSFPVKAEMENRAKSQFDSSPLFAADEEDSDLLDWLENLPHGQTVSSGFASKPPAIELAESDSIVPPPRTPRTSRQMMRELMPGAHARQTIPAWTGWLNTGLQN